MKDFTKQTEADPAYEKLVRSVSKVIDTNAGRDVIWEILGITGLYNNSFTGNSTTFFNEGKRSVGWDILQMLNDADPAAYARMQLEQLKLEG